MLLATVAAFSSCKSKEHAAVQVGQDDKHPAVSKGTLSGREKMRFDELFYNALKEKMLRNYDLAESLFSQALKLDPGNGAAMYELADIYLFQNNKNMALFYSKKAAESDPKNNWYQIRYAECLKENKQHAEVANVLEKMIKNSPERIEFYYELANAYLYANKINDAVKTYNKIEERIGVTEEASMQKLKIYKSSNNFEKAVEEAQKLIKTFPKEAKYYGILGELYQEKGQPEKAFEAYQELLKVDPENAYVHLSLADYYRNQKQNEKAFEEIKVAFKSKELDIDTKVKILLSYYSITESFPELKTDADELCKLIVEVHPNEAKAFSIYGDFLYRDKKLEEARVQYRKAIELDKEKYALWNQLLVIESELSDFIAMEKESAEAMEYFPSQALPYFFNGAAKMQLKKYKEAVSVLTEGKEFVYDNKLLLAQFYANIGDAQNQLKNHDASDEAYEKALQIDPSNIYVLNNYAYYLSLRNKNLEKAEAMSKKSNELQPNVNSYEDTYGWILYQMKKYEEAKVWIGKALDHGGRSSGILLEHYGDVLYQLGDKESALKYWMDAKKLGGTTEMLNKKIEDKKLYE
jgi:tetratricopeptide (TPR) repeat protein